MPDSATLRIVLAQINTLVGDIDGNLKKMIAAAERARDEMQADAVAFPELALTGYPPEDLLLRLGLHRRVQRAVVELRDAVPDITVIVGYPRKTDSEVYNSAAVLRGGESVGYYDKQLLPNYSVFDEKRYFTAGTAPLIVDIKGVPVCILICEDVWHPEPMAQAAQAGARLAVVINASPYHMSKQEERESVVRHRVKETGLPVAYLNLVGGQDELVFDGASFVMDGHGQLVFRAPAWVEELYTVDFTVGEEVAPVSGPCWPVLPRGASVYQALVTGVRDYVNKNGFSGAVLGLSGGIDSALTLAIAVDALGADRVEAVMMPSRHTSAMSTEDARAEAEALGVEYHEISIEPAYQAFLDSLQGEFSGAAPDVTEENIQARVRGVLLMAISNKKRKIVLTTGNKSEMAVGYATLYGDMAGGFDVLKDVPKHLVYRLADHRNSIDQVIPRRVFDRPPTAELAPDQTDQDTLPPYSVLDGILELYIERDQCAEDIMAQGYEEITVRRVVRMVDRNEYKRRQAPPGVRVTRRAFGKDRRYPITSGFNRESS